MSSFKGLNLPILIVFSFLGLISCSSDEPIPVIDNYNMPPPQLIDESGEQKILNLQTELKKLQLSDRLEFTDANTQEIEITLNCIVDKQENFSSSRRLNAKASIAIFELVSPAILSLPQNKEALCNFTFVGSNQYGSTHKLDVNSVKISLEPTERLPEVRVFSGRSRIERSSISSFSEKDLPSIYFLGNSQKFDQAELYCGREKVSSSQKSWPVYFEDFDWLNLSNKIFVKRRATCRLFATSKDKIVGVSQFFFINKDFLRAKYVKNINMDFPKPKNSRYLMGSLELSNPYDEPLYLKWSLTGHSQADHRIYFKYFEKGNPAKKVWIEKKSDLHIETNLTPITQGKFKTITIPPQSKAQLRLFSNISYKCTLPGIDFYFPLYYLRTTLLSDVKVEQVEGLSGEGFNRVVSSATLFSSGEHWRNQNLTNTKGDDIESIYSLNEKFIRSHTRLICN